MTEPLAKLEPRASKRARKPTGLQPKGPDLQAVALLKYNLKLPLSFTPGAIQANRLALQVVEDRCLAYVANAQHVYEVSLGSDCAAACSASWAGANKGKEGVLVPSIAQVGNIRELEPLSYMEAEVQGLYAGIHGGHHILAAVDAVGNARVLAEPLVGPGDLKKQQQVEEEGVVGTAGGRRLLSLHAPNRGECGWTGLAVRSLGSALAAAAEEGRGGGGGGGGAREGVGLDPESTVVEGGPALEVAVARQLLRDVVVYRDGVWLRTLHTMQGPTALTYLAPEGPFGGSSEAISGLLAVAEENQVSLWDVRQGERGGCIQRLGVYGSGFPVYGLSWLSTAAVHGCTGEVSRQQQQQGPGRDGEGLLAAAGGERSVVVLEPRKWHIVAKWPGCVKYPATLLRASALAPGYVYVAGLDYECVAGRWDGSCGSSSGNANSSSGGHGRAAGPAQIMMQRSEQQQEAMATTAYEGAEGGVSDRGGLSFRGDSKWLGLASCIVPPQAGTMGNIGMEDVGWREMAAALSLSGHLYVLVSSASAAADVPVL